MRLGLGRKLRPYQNLLELAHAFDVTLPRLRRQIAELESEERLSLPNLARALEVSPPETDEELFLSFHRRELCLVCGTPMQRAEGRQAGWGEFMQCPFCAFSAHENADFSRMREAASAQVDDLRAAASRAQRILSERKRRGQSLD